MFLPCITMGSLIGRLYGETLKVLIGDSVTNMGGYAYVGAGAFTACVTRTTSVAIIIFELSG